MPDHTIDYELATTLGLGVVKNLLVEDDYYLYNASRDQPDHFGMMHEVTRMGVYYQITHPEYDDWDLEDLIIDTKGGKEFLELLQTVETDMPYKRLKEVFDNKKGVVLPFQRKF